MPPLEGANGQVRVPGRAQCWVLGACAAVELWAGGCEPSSHAWSERFPTTPPRYQLAVIPLFARSAYADGVTGRSDALGVPALVFLRTRESASSCAV